MKLIRCVLGAGIVCTIAACASTPGPGMEGGIVGTGNRPDCEALKRRSETPLPAECRRLPEPPPYR
jgi:hypothetical protein